MKPHPRVDPNIYTELGIEIFDKDVPWEVYCLNNNIEEKILICTLTSAAVMPYILYGVINQIVSVCDMIPNRHPFARDMKDVFNTINRKENNIEFPKNDLELEKILKKVL